MMDNNFTEKYVTVTGFYHYYGREVFKLGRNFTCVKEPENHYDDEAIRVEDEAFGTVGYIANSTQTRAIGTYSAGKIGSKVKKKFTVQVMFVTSSKIICKVVDGFKKKEKEDMPDTKGEQKKLEIYF